MADAPKLKQEKRSHLTPEQEAAFSELRNILDPKSQTFNPVSRLGAQLMQERGQQIEHWQTPLNVYGLTFHGDYLPPENVDKAETNMLRETGLGPIGARNQIAVGPEALTGKRKDVIPHELAHLAIQLSDIQSYGIEEALVRQLMIKDGLAMKDNMEFLSATTRIDDKNVMSVIDDIARAAAKEAEKKLKPKAKGK